MGAATGATVRSSATCKTSALRRERVRRCKASRSRRQISHDRRSNRAYMREWRANPKNRTTERHRAAGWRLRRKLAQLAARKNPDMSGEQCAYCHQAAITRIDRLRATKDGFRPIVLPYCGLC